MFVAIILKGNPSKGSCFDKNENQVVIADEQYDFQRR